MRIEIIIVLALCAVCIFTFVILPYLNHMPYQCFLDRANIQLQNDTFYNEWCR